MRRLDRIPFTDESRPPLKATDEIVELPKVNKQSSSVLRCRSVIAGGDFSEFNLNQMSRSLDPFPSNQRNKVSFMDKLKKKSSISLEQGVSTISQHKLNDCHEEATVATDGCKFPNNNCNGSANVEDQTSPLLLRQTSFNDCEDVHSTLLDKKWKSLEARMDEDDQSGASAAKGSIKSWLMGIFQGNGFKNSNSSFKVSIMNQGVKEMPVIDVPASTQNESIV